MKMLAVVGLVLMLAGCAGGRDFSMDNVAKVKPGMSQDEVKALVGEPASVSISGNRTIWAWARTDGMGGSKAASVTFLDGKVSDVPTHMRTTR